MTFANETASPTFSPTFLGFTSLIGLFGLITNSYAAKYMTNNFDLSKMTYKTLLWCCSINVIGFIVLLVTSLYLVNASESKLVCTVFQVSLQYQLFIVQCHLLLIFQDSWNLLICLLRCIISCSKKNAEELISLQKSLINFMMPLPFAGLGTFYIYRMSNEKPLNFVHLVSCKVNIFAKLVKMILISVYRLLFEMNQTKVLSIFH